MDYLQQDDCVRFVYTIYWFIATKIQIKGCLRAAFN